MDRNPGKRVREASPEKSSKSVTKPGRPAPDWLEKQLEALHQIRLERAAGGGPSGAPVVPAPSSSESDNVLSVDSDSPKEVGEEFPPFDPTVEFWSDYLRRIDKTEENWNHATILKLLRSSTRSDQREKKWKRKWKEEKRLRKKMQADIKDLQQMVYGENQMETQSVTAPANDPAEEPPEEPQRERQEWVLHLMSPAWTPRWAPVDPRTRRR